MRILAIETSCDETAEKGAERVQQVPGGRFASMVILVNALKRLLQAACLRPMRQLFFRLRQHLLWRRRIADVLRCPDNARVPRVQNAGEVVDGWQTMHNGLRVKVDGYYGSGITRMLKQNRGCHEPQEEAVFRQILPAVPRGSVIVEAGAYWAFYSMWFLKEVPQSRAFLIEPGTENLEVGRQNFFQNSLVGEFTQAFVGDKTSLTVGGLPTVSIDTFAAERQLVEIGMLHADVQGHEVAMLAGCGRLLGAKQIAYLFISTHGESLHRECLVVLRGYGYTILADVPLAQTCSVDGLIVACAPHIAPPTVTPPTPKSA